MIASRHFRVITNGTGNEVASAAVTFPFKGILRRFDLRLTPVPNGTLNQDWCACWFAQSAVEGTRVFQAGLITPTNVFGLVTRYVMWPDLINQDRLEFMSETLTAYTNIPVDPKQNFILQAMTQTATNQVEGRITVEVESV